jgi:hypothetical protein
MEAVIPQPLGLSRLTELICEDRSTRKVRQVREAGVTVVGDGAWLTLGEVVERLNAALGEGRYNVAKVRRFADVGYFHTEREPAIGAGPTHRRVKAESVDEYLAVMALPAAERAAALAELVRKHKPEPPAES